LISDYIELITSAGLKPDTFYQVQDLSTPATHVVGPNVDTLYGVAVADLTRGPQVIGVPATGARYYSLQLIDVWGNSFAYIGTRATGNKAGAFALTPPGWHGRLPRGVKEIKAPTSRLLILARTFAADEADVPAARLIHNAYTFGPLAHYPRQRIKAVPSTAQALNFFSPINIVPSGASLYEQLNGLLAQYPPAPGVDARYARTLRPLGVDVRHYVPPSAALAAILSAAVAPAVDAALEGLLDAFVAENGWSVILDVQPVTHDYALRAGLVLEGPGYHIAREALYFSVGSVDKVALSGASTYALTFPAGQLPPVGAFWSLTLYDPATGWLVANSIDRYAISNRTPGIEYNADGSLTLTISNAEPAAGTSNWLPAPTGGYRLTLRTYLPTPEILDGTWQPPALVQVA
jgi:hypothetical protein